MPVLAVRGFARSPRAAARAIVAALLVAGLTGCALFRRYDMAQIHEASSASPERHPLIVIHGFVGSKLRNPATDESVWGSFANAITRSKTDDLSLPIDRPTLAEDRDALEPYALYETVAGVKFYGALMDSLRSVGGYQVGDLGDPRPGDNCFVFVYDWRRDNVESARSLARAMRAYKTRVHDDRLTFDIVAHSMGGLVALYELMYGDRDLPADGGLGPVPWAGTEDVHRLILLGTPLRGTMAAFRLLQNGMSRSMSPDVVFTMPSVYELLPQDGQRHFVDPAGRPVGLDLRDARVWRERGWSVFASRGRAAAVDSRDAPPDPLEEARMRFLQMALDRARLFRAALDAPGRDTPPIPVSVFGSDCVPTLDRALLRETSAGTQTLFDDEATPDRNARQMDRLLLAPGDGTVTARSLLGADEDAAEVEGGARFGSTFFVCETHGLLPANPAFQDNLFYVLLQGPPRAAAGARTLGSGR